MNRYTENNKKYKHINVAVPTLLMLMGMGSTITILQAVGELAGVTPTYSGSTDTSNTLSESTASNQSSIPVRWAQQRAAVTRRQGGDAARTIATMTVQEYHDHLMSEAATLKNKWGQWTQDKKIQEAQKFTTQTRPTPVSRLIAVTDNDKTHDALKMAEWINVSSAIRREAQGSRMP